MMDNNERRYILNKCQEILQVIGKGHVGKKEREIRRIAKELEEMVK